MPRQPKEPGIHPSHDVPTEIHVGNKEVDEALAREALLAPLRQKPWYLRFKVEVNLVWAGALLLAVGATGLGLGLYSGYSSAVRELLSTPGYSYDNEAEPVFHDSVPDSSTPSPLTTSPASRFWPPFGRPVNTPSPTLINLSKIEQKQVIEKATTVFLIKFYATKTAVAEQSATPTAQVSVTAVPSVVQTVAPTIVSVPTIPVIRIP